MSRQRVLAISVALVLVLGIGLRLALPGLARDAASKAISEATGRVAEIGDLSLELLAGRVTLETFSLAGAAQPLLALERLSLQLSYRALLSGRIEVEGLALSGLACRLDPSEPLVLATEDAVAAEPEPVGEETGWPILIEGIQVADLKLSIGDSTNPTQFLLPRGELDFVRVDSDGVALGALRLDEPQLRTAQPGAAAEPTAEAATEPFRFGRAVDELPGTRIAGLQIRRGEVELATAEGPVELGLDVSFAELVLKRGGETHFSLDTRWGEGTLALDGNLVLDPLRFDGTLNWADVAVTALAPFMAGLTPDAGKTSAELRIDFAVDESGEREGLRAGAGGELAILDARFTDPEQQVLGWKSLLLSLRDLRWSQLANESPSLVVQLEAVRLAGPELEWSARAQSAPPSDRAAESADASLAVEIVVDLVQITDGRIVARDASVKPPLAAKARFEATVQALSWPAQDIGLLSLSVTGEEGESLSVSGKVESGKGRLEIDLDSLSLPRFDGYASSRGGVGIEKGSLSWRGGVDLLDSAAQVKGKLVLADLDLEDRDKGALESLLGNAIVGVPYDVALTMLRDPKGRIPLSIVARVDGRGTRLDLARILRDAVQQAVVGALSTPLATLNLVSGFVFKDGDMPLPAIAFAPGSALPSAAAEERLAALAEVLKAREDIGARLAGRSGAADAAHLSGADAGAALTALAQARARACSDHLVERLGVRLERVTLGDPSEGSPGVSVVLHPRGGTSKP